MGCILINNIINKVFQQYQATCESCSGRGKIYKSKCHICKGAKIIPGSE